MHLFFYRTVIAIVRFLLKFVIRLKIVGKENIPMDGPCIICCNHVAWFDGVIMVLIHKRVVKVMSKKEIFDFFLTRWIMKFVYFFPVDRDKNDVNAVKTALKILKDGEPLGIFPEGTRSKSGVLLPFHDGPVTLAFRQKVPIVPMGRSGRTHIFGKICVSIGEPFYIESDSRRLSKEETAAATQLLREHIISEVEKAEQLKHG